MLRTNVRTDRGARNSLKNSVIRLGHRQVECSVSHDLSVFSFIYPVFFLVPVKTYADHYADHYTHPSFGLY